MRLLPWIVACCWWGLAGAQGLPAEIDAALARAGLPREAVTVLVTDVDPAAPARLAHRTHVAVNPASIAKLATTFAALELLGPAFSWSTTAHADGPLQDGTLAGNLYLAGSGDPKLVVERLWLLLRRLRALGIERIAGDIVLDASAFSVPAGDPGAFDGEPLRPYNAAPDALLLNFRSVVLTLVPQPGASARVLVEPPLAGVQWPASVPLLAGDCSDWRTALRLDARDPLQPRLNGGYPAACGERSWPLAYADPASYGPRLLAAMWQAVGGRHDGRVRDGRLPPGLPALAETASPPLAEVVRDINKFSNNVMAQQVFLTLSHRAHGLGTRDASRQLLAAWWRERLGADVPHFDNGSGLSRDERATAAQLGRLLQYAWRSPLMPELVASLPLAGSDGTLRRTTQQPAHLKTGSLRDVWGVAGYVHGTSGRRYVLVAIANHPRAAALRPVADLLVAWAARDR